MNGKCGRQEDERNEKGEVSEKHDKWEELLGKMSTWVGRKRGEWQGCYR